MANRVVIVGAGYAGLRVARDVAGTAGLEVVLVSATDHHVDVTSFYEVATARLPRESARSSELISGGFGVGLEEITARWPIKLKIGRVDMLNTADRLLLFQDKTTLSYDRLVLAVGAETALYGVPGVAEHAFFIKTLPEALRLRHHITRYLKMAAEVAGQGQAALRTFVVVGGGVTGVEFANELAGLLRHWQRTMPELAPRIILLEANERLLKEAPADLSARLGQRLKQLGVTVRLQQAVVAVGEREVTLRTGETIATQTVLWAGGLQTAGLLVRARLPQLKWGIRVQDTLQVEGWPDIFAVGDCAVVAGAEEAIPATVPVAYAQAAVVARNLRRQAAGRRLQSYRYRRRSQIITLGGTTALMVWPGGSSVMGWWPWLLKHAVLWVYWCHYVTPWRAWQLLKQQVAVERQND